MLLRKFALAFFDDICRSFILNMQGEICLAVISWTHSHIMSLIIEFSKMRQCKSLQNLISFQKNKLLILFI
jgi:hypothetical protein